MHPKRLNSLSIIVSVYNEQDSLLSFWNKLKDVLTSLPTISFEIIFVNDGSHDDSKKLIGEIINDSNNNAFEFIAIDFSKNFGHESAMIAGIDLAAKEAVVCLDSDLQHPPEKIMDMVSKYNEGYEIVTMIRTKRADNGMTKNTSSSIFYKLLNNLSDYKFDKNASDFFLISGRVAQVLKENFRERNRFLRGYIQTIGFSKASVYFEAPSRIGGESSYSFVKLLKLSFTAIFPSRTNPCELRCMLHLFLPFLRRVSASTAYSFTFSEKLLLRVIPR